VSLRRSSALFGVAVAAAALLTRNDAEAAEWRLEPALRVEATWTDNANFGSRTSRRDDVITEVAPSLSLRATGRRLRISGAVEAAYVSYAEGTSDDTLLPRGSVLANLEVIERLFFLEAAASASQTRVDPFGPQPDGGSSLNTGTTTQYRISPYIEGGTGTLSYALRSDNSWAEQRGAGSAIDRDGAYLGVHSARLERSATPLGWRLRLARNETRFESAIPDRVTQDTARLTADYLLGAQVRIGLVGGYETNDFSTTDDSGAIWGVAVRWRPGERTDFDATWEQRFFGTGYSAGFNHRNPRVAWAISASRDASTFPQTLFGLAPTDNVAALLDAIYTTRYPDPAERNRVVQQLIAQQGLPPSLTTSTTLFTQNVSLVSSGTATVTLIGVRNSLAFSLFTQRTEELRDTIFAITGAADRNNVQRGGSATLSHRVTTLTALNATASVRRTQGIGASETERSEQVLYRLTMTRQLGPRTTVVVGARRQHFDSTLLGVKTDARETAGFAGASHRF